MIDHAWDVIEHDAVWDVIVVGAGPAGAAAAHAAASAGARVLLLDKATPPRYKTCGGGIIGASLAAMPAALQPPLCDQVRAVSFTWRGRLRRTRRVPSTAPPLFGLVKRAELDEQLTRAATAAGAVLHTGRTVVGVDVIAATSGSEGSGREVVEVSTRDGRRYLARCVIGADGSASRIARDVGVVCEQVDLGLEAEIPVPPAVAHRWSGRLALDWGVEPGSYAWVFPKGDSLSVGVIGQRNNGDSGRAYFRQFVERMGLAGYEPTVSSGHLTRCRASTSPLHRGRILVAGDAGGLLEPFTREGISFALRSGELAGQHAHLMSRHDNTTSRASIGDGALRNGPAALAEMPQVRGEA